jgi:RNA polymerase sigma-70 factor (ECF subfamily)
MTRPQPDSEETRDLVRRARAGDREAFESLFGRYRAALRSFIDLRLDPRLRARVDPSDVVQEAHVDAWNGLESYLEREPMPFRLWLHKTAFQRLLKVQRHHLATRRSVEREASLPDRSSLLLARNLLAGAPSPAEKLAAEEVARRVRRVLQELGGTDREILLMRNVEELSYDEVGYLLEINPSAARKRYGRALIRLQKALADDGLLESHP